MRTENNTWSKIIKWKLRLVLLSMFLNKNLTFHLHEVFLSPSVTWWWCFRSPCCPGLMTWRTRSCWIYCPCLRNWAVPMTFTPNCVSYESRDLPHHASGSIAKPHNLETPLQPLTCLNLSERTSRTSQSVCWCHLSHPHGSAWCLMFGEMITFHSRFYFCFIFVWGGRTKHSNKQNKHSDVNDESEWI